MLSAVMLMTACSLADAELKDVFLNPPAKYRPMPFWHLNGELTKEHIEKQITEAKTLSRFGGVAVLPVSPRPQHPTGIPCPGMSPAFLSEDYFERYADILTVSGQQGTEVILYDDIDFPSGTAGGRLQKEYPRYTQKILIKDELLVDGNVAVNYPYPTDALKELIAVSAMNIDSLEVLDLASQMKDGVLEWTSPAGKWRIMFFACQYNISSHVDYMQPEAVSKLIEFTYNQYDKRLRDYFGTTINKVFFDDVGFVHQEQAWTPSITTIFKERFGRNPALYYPALFYDVGPETQATRVAFYDIRSELMGEGYVKQISRWAAERGLQSIGHPPENYSPNPVVALGDPFKYYRHVDIPLLDAIFYYGRGLHGFKQVSSAADIGDKPVVGAELCGAFSADMDSATLNRVVMEAFARGVNFVIPHGMWYDTAPERVAIPPLIAPENPRLKDALPAYSDMCGRSCAILQGGRRVSEIAVLYPIAAIQAESYINRDATSGLPVANWLPEGVNHHQLSDLLTNKLRRDFTFIHPENLTDGKITAIGKKLTLNNKTNRQTYNVLIIPGGNTVSATTLKAIKAYYDGGGNVIATAALPAKSAEFGQDNVVRGIITELFGIDPVQNNSPAESLTVNNNGGQIAFLKTVTAESLNALLEKMGILPDVSFDESSIPAHSIGYLNYIHKQKDGINFYYLTNTTEKDMTIKLRLRDSFKSLELWNPHNGSITAKDTGNGEISVFMPAVSAMFVAGKN
jgi:hypothetical protein